MDCRKVLIAAGGSGGHLLPAQQLGELLEERGEQVLFAGYKLEKSPYFSRGRFEFREIRSAPLGGWAFLKSLWVGFFQALKVLRKENPDLVVGFGSYHAVPVLLAALFLRRKMVLYEANRIKGKVNRLFSPFAKAIALQLPPIGKRSKKEVFVSWTSKEKVVYEKAQARKELGLKEDVLTILVFGGSQGASFFNEIMPQVAKLLGQVQFIHLTGKEETVGSLEKEYAGKALVKGFETNMPRVYAACDLAICRSGAGTIGELISFHVPSILIPYPQAAEDHQRLNGEFLVAKGAAALLLQKEATASKIIEMVQGLELEKMKLALRAIQEQNGNFMKMDELVFKLAREVKR